jgi:hypothetical protein
MVPLPFTLQILIPVYCNVWAADMMQASGGDATGNAQASFLSMFPEAA